MSSQRSNNSSSSNESSKGSNNNMHMHSQPKRQRLSNQTRHENESKNENIVPVDLPDGRGYPILFRGVDELGFAIRDALVGGDKDNSSTSKSNSGSGSTKKISVSNCVVVSNDVVGPLYKDRVIAAINKAGFKNTGYVEIEDGEAAKTAETYVKLVNDLLGVAKVDRKTLLIALGGGVTTDIVGFAAATTLRGLNFVNVPTSLLAMVDASVGGKTGVNTKHGKNLLGAFWQPVLVNIAVETLDSLSDAELRCGLGEVVKHAVLEEDDDEEEENGRSGKGLEDSTAVKPSSRFFQWLEQNAKLLRERDRGALEYAAKRCCEIKACIVIQDERESGKRALLNLGHTVGHAIEQVMGYGEIRHGEAVGIGTVAEAQLASMRNLADPKLTVRIARLLNDLNLPYGLKGLNVDSLLEAVWMDKKREQEEITITVPKAIGEVILEKVKPEELRRAFEYLAKAETELASQF